MLPAFDNAVGTSPTVGLVVNVEKMQNGYFSGIEEKCKDVVGVPKFLLGSLPRLGSVPPLTPLSTRIVLIIVFWLIDIKLATFVVFCSQPKHLSPNPESGQFPALAFSTANVVQRSAGQTAKFRLTFPRWRPSQQQRPCVALGSARRCRLKPLGDKNIHVLCVTLKPQKLLRIIIPRPPYSSNMCRL